MLLISCALTRSLSSSLLLLLLLLFTVVVAVVIHSCLLLLLSCCMWAAFVVEMPLINEFWLFCWNDVGKCALIYIQTNTHKHTHRHTHTQCVTHTHTGIRSELQTNSKYTQKTLESTRTSGHLETVWSDLGRWCRANQFETRNSIRWFIKSIKSSF